MKFTIPKCETCTCRQNSLLNFCRLEELLQISTSKTCNLYRKDHAVFYENVFPIGLFCINAGAIKLSKLASSGKEQIIRIARPGDFIGYRSLITNTPYTVTATALEDSTICLIPKTMFFNLIKANTKFYEALMQLLCSDLEEMENKLGAISYKPVRGRIAEALMLLSSTYEDSDYINLTREDLASYVGTVKETVIRIISEFKDEKLIQIDKRRIKILNADGLMQISSMYD